MRLEDLPERYQKYDTEEITLNAEALPNHVERLGSVKDDAEKQYLISIMQKHDGNIKRICQETQLSRSRIYQLLNKFNLQPADFRWRPASRP